MNEAVSRRTGAAFPGKTTAGCQNVPEFDESACGMLSRVRSINAMMQVNLNFTPPRVAMLG